MRPRALAVVGTFAWLAACAGNMPVEMLRLAPEAAANRQMQTRRFETDDERRLLAASSALLQDLGFTISESAPEVGVIVASKDRDARETRQIVGAILLAFIGVSQPIDVHQRIHATLVTRPLGGAPPGVAVRVTFNRAVFSSGGPSPRHETINDAAIYRDFFDRLSKAVFLEAHNL